MLHEYPLEETGFLKFVAFNNLHEKPKTENELYNLIRKEVSDLNIIATANFPSSLEFSSYKVEPSDKGKEIEDVRWYAYLNVISNHNKELLGQFIIYKYDNGKYRLCNTEWGEILNDQPSCTAILEDTIKSVGITLPIDVDVYEYSRD